MDKDFPMTGTQLKALLIGLVVMGGFGMALFSGVVPGFKPTWASPAVISLDNGSYYHTTFDLTTPLPLANSSSSPPFVFHNVTFNLRVSNWYALTGGLVYGNGTEANGTAYPFVLGESPRPVVHTTLYFSPDGEFGVAWPGGLLGGSWVQLYVRA